MCADINCGFPRHGCLTSWAEQGVLLLNTVLTVREGMPNSHSNIGWETFTTNIILNINKYLNKVIFLFWGMKAAKKKVFVNEQKHFILTTSHPSPLSVNNGFFGCKHFSKSNSLLKSIKQTPINWEIKSK